jgi:hypothetical protein
MVGMMVKPNKFRVGDIVRATISYEQPRDFINPIGKILQTPDHTGRSVYYKTSITLTPVSVGSTNWREDELELAANGLDFVFKWLDNAPYG